MCKYLNWRTSLLTSIPHRDIFAHRLTLTHSCNTQDILSKNYIYMSFFYSSIMLYY